MSLKKNTEARPDFIFQMY